MRVIGYAIVPKDRKIDFIKLDVEGAELLVLRGATELIRRDRPAIVFETGPDDQNSMGLAGKELFLYFAKELGYSIYLMKDFLARGEGADARAIRSSAAVPVSSVQHACGKGRMKR